MLSLSHMKEKWLTPAEAAKHLGVSMATIYRYLNAPKNPLPSYKLSESMIRIEIIELNKWVKKHCCGKVIINDNKVWTESEMGGPTYE